MFIQQSYPPRSVRVGTERAGGVEGEFVILYVEFRVEGCEVLPFFCTDCALVRYSCFSGKGVYSSFSLLFFFSVHLFYLSPSDQVLCNTNEKKITA